MHRVSRVLRIEWAFYGRRIRLAVILALALAALVAFEIGEALLPHQVQNTILKYQEKSNGSRQARLAESEPSTAHTVEPGAGCVAAGRRSD